MHGDVFFAPDKDKHVSRCIPMCNCADSSQYSVISRLYMNNSNQDFVGRASELARLDEWMSGNEAVGIVHGIVGIGKSKLALRFVRRLVEQNRVSEERVFRYSFDLAPRSVASILKGPGMRFLGPEFVLQSMPNRIESLATILKKNECLMFLDGFEAVTGVESDTAPSFSLSDQQHLKQLLCSLRGGKSKVLITSRTMESWLGTESCSRMELDGFDDDNELWTCARGNCSVGRLISDRLDSRLRSLLELTDGHPIAVRVLGQMLNHYSAEELYNTVVTIMIDPLPDVGSTTERRLFGFLRSMERLVPGSLRDFLAPLAMHDRYVSRDDLEAIAVCSGAETTRLQIDHCLQLLSSCGLLKQRTDDTYEIDGTLTRYLRVRGLASTDEETQRSFATVMATRASGFRPVGDHGELAPFGLYFRNFRTALDYADRFNLTSEFCTLLRWLKLHPSDVQAVDIQVRALQQRSQKVSPANTKTSLLDYHKQGMMAWQLRDFAAAEDLLRRAIDDGECDNANPVHSSLVYSLGLVLLGQSKLSAALKCLEQARYLHERDGDECRLARVCLDVASVATREARFDDAQVLIHRAQNLLGRQSDQFCTAKIYDSLGILAREMRKGDEAFEWFGRSLAISETSNDLVGLAFTLQHMAVLATSTGHFDAAQNYLERAIGIHDAQRNEYELGALYYRMGVNTYKNREFLRAERWFRESIELSERSSNEFIAAMASYGLALLRVDNEDLDAAAELLGGGIRILERLGVDDVADLYHHLGLVEHERGNQDVAESLYMKALLISKKRHDDVGAAKTTQNLGILAQQRKDFVTAMKWLHISLEIKQRRGNKLAIAKTQYQLGRVAEEQGELDTAIKWYSESVSINLQHGNENDAAKGYFLLGRIADMRGQSEVASQWLRKALEIFTRLGDKRGVSQANELLLRVTRG